MSCRSLPPRLRQQADRAEKRMDEALDRLIRRVNGALPAGDLFESAMRALIDPDKGPLEPLKRNAQ
jgi:hypothetical protein